MRLAENPICIRSQTLQTNCCNPNSALEEKIHFMLPGPGLKHRSRALKRGTNEGLLSRACCPRAFAVLPLQTSCRSRGWLVDFVRQALVLFYGLFFAPSPLVRYFWQYHGFYCARSRLLSNYYRVCSVDGAITCLNFVVPVRNRYECRSSFPTYP